MHPLTFCQQYGHRRSGRAVHTPSRAGLWMQAELLREDPGRHLVPVSTGTTNLPSSCSPPRPSPRLRPPTAHPSRLLLLLSSLSLPLSSKLPFLLPCKPPPVPPCSVPKRFFSSSFFRLLSAFLPQALIPPELLIVFLPLSKCPSETSPPHLLEEAPHSRGHTGGTHTLHHQISKTPEPDSTSPP